MRRLRGMVRCDARGCGWCTDRQQVLRDWFGKHCPNCGAALTNATDKAAVFLGEFLMALGLVKQPVEPNGEGKFTISTDRRSQS